jgi:hypothetical protein
MNYRIQIIIVSSLSLAGCFATTTHGMRERPPTLALDTSRSVAEIVGCVTGITDRGVPATFTPKPNGGTLTVFYQIPTMVIDLEDRGSTRHATMWMVNTIWAKRNRHFLEEIQSCLQP